MDNALLMRHSQGVGHGNGDVEQLRQGHPLGGDQLVQTLAIDQLHGEEIGTLTLFDVVDGDDIGMVEGGHRFGLALEALEAFRIVGHVGRQ